MRYIVYAQRWTTCRPGFEHSINQCVIRSLRFSRTFKNWYHADADPGVIDARERQYQRCIGRVQGQLLISQEVVTTCWRSKK